MKDVRFTDHELVEIQPPRDLTPHERSVLELLIGESSLAAAARCQLDRASVSAECIDRCGTIELEVPTEPCPPLGSDPGLLADGEAAIKGDVHQAVLLFGEAGRIRYLETYRTDGQRPAGLPLPGDVTLLKRLG